MIERLRVRILAGAAGEFSYPESALCADLFGVSFHPVLPQWHVKDPGYSAKSAGYAYTHKTPLNQRSRSGLIIPLCRRSVGIPQFTRSSSGNTRSRSSQESIEVFGNMRYCILQQTFFMALFHNKAKKYADKKEST